MSLLKMVEENDFVGLKNYVEGRRMDLLKNRVELKKKSIRESFQEKETKTK